MRINHSNEKILYPVNIDFDESQKAWRENKKALPNGMFRYTCKGITKKGMKCNNNPLNCGYCHLHSKKDYS